MIEISHLNSIRKEYRDSEKSISDFRNNMIDTIEKKLIEAAKRDQASITVETRMFGDDNLSCLVMVLETNGYTVDKITGDSGLYEGRVLAITISY